MSLLNDYFPKKTEINPRLYAYTDEIHEGKLKIGQTDRDVKERVREQYTLSPRKTWKIVFNEPRFKNDGTVFSDKMFHRYLVSQGYKQEKQEETSKITEWFEINIDELKTRYFEFTKGIKIKGNRVLDFDLRPEQKDAVDKTYSYFKKFENSDITPHFLWNCKMRFGKTFATYKLAQKMNWRKILVITYKPAVEGAWRTDLNDHIDFDGWQFYSEYGDDNLKDINMEKPLVCFGSFQDYLGRGQNGAIKRKNQWLHEIEWDGIIIDEYHFGAWRKNAKELYDEDSIVDVDYENYIGGEKDELEYLEHSISLKNKNYLYLSGTPFRALLSGEFNSDQIYSWTYSDEQKAKIEWKNDENPYLELPKLIMLTYQIPKSVMSIASEGMNDEFDLNVFFSSEGKEDNARFVYENDVQKWLNFIKGDYAQDSKNIGRASKLKPYLPFEYVNLLENLNHTLWFLPDVASCYAMANLLKRKNNTFYHEYKIIVAAGNKAGMGIKALDPVREAMGSNPLVSKTITLTCSKLTTGVTVKPWTGIFMLRNLKSPETYFQTAFRVQSPWKIKQGDDVESEEIIKKECYIFDFAPNRALKLISDYSSNINQSNNDPEKKIEDFISFLPVLAYDGISMREVDASAILDIVLSGTTGYLMARKWDSSLLVNMDGNTLKKLFDNEKAMNALMKIEDFRSLNRDVEMIINVTDDIKSIRKNKKKDDLNKKEKLEINKKEKENAKMRREIQKKLQKFLTKIPIFMYMSEYRERTLKDVITKLEPVLFKKVTGLEVEDFELLISLGLFNSNLMNDTIFAFKKYEDGSLDYDGITKYEFDKIGGFDVVLNRDELEI